MSEHPLTDGSLSALETRLLASRPELGEEMRLRLLYESAFAAGCHSSRGTRRIWQTIAGAAVLVCLLQTIAWRPQNSAGPVPIKSAPQTMPNVEPQNLETAPTEPVVPATEPHLPAEIAVTVPGLRRLNLDAWQLSDDDGRQLSGSLRRFAELSLTDRGQTVIGMQSATAIMSAH